MTEKEELNIILNNYCVGCGTCLYSQNQTIGELSESGMFSPKGLLDVEDELTSILEVCPFSSKAKNEDVLSETYFGPKVSNKKDILGRYLDCGVSYVNNEEDRLKSSSGGIITYLLLELLRRKEITQAVFVTQSERKGRLFDYKISSDKNDISNGASTKYYPVELSGVLKHIRENEGTYAIVALPCMAKSIRLLQNKHNIIRERLKFIISPICGHLKSSFYSDFLAWQVGVKPKNIGTINYRTKLKDSPASCYATRVKSKDNRQDIIHPNSDFIMGVDWGHGMFKYPVCDYCDDVVGELADVSVGDAWLSKYIGDYQGQSIVIVRDQTISKIISDAKKNGHITYSSVSSDEVLLSQAGGIRHKRQDLQYRLYIKQKSKEWYPPKRVMPSVNKIKNRRRGLIKMRIAIREKSFRYFVEALRYDEISFFYKKMAPILNRYSLINLGVIVFLKRKIKKLL